MQQTLSYQKLTQLRTPDTESKLTNEQRFWKKYQGSLFSTDAQHQVQCISSDHNTRNLLAVGQGRSIKVINPSSKQPQVLQELSPFYENVSALCIRKDGNVLAAADESGRIEVIDMKQKFHLRKFHHHRKRVNALQYIQNDLYSAGDDFLIRHYDVAAGSIVHSYEDAHSDYIKSIKALENNHILSGGYDGAVNLFDFRVHEKAQAYFKHQEQVESLDLYPSNLSFVVAGGNKVSIWDIRSDKQPLFQAKNNKKAVTNVRLVSNGTRYITTSLDRYVKVFKSDTFELTYQQKMDGGVLAFDAISNTECLAFGVEGGKVILKTRAALKQETDTDGDSDVEIQDEIAMWMQKNSQSKFAYNDQYFYRGIYEQPKDYDIKFERFQTPKLGNLDKYLKKFEYKRALIECMEKKNMTVFLSLVDQLIQRGALVKSLKSLTGDELLLVESFLKSLICNEKYSHVSNYVLLELLKLHSKELNMSTLRQGNDGVSLAETVDRQMEVIAEIRKTEGMLEIVENFLQ